MTAMDLSLLFTEVANRAELAKMNYLIHDFAFQDSDFGDA